MATADHLRPSVMFIAGDPSGDVHAAKVLVELQRHVPQVHCFGIGGSRMEEAGFEALLPFEPFNRMGVVEVLAHLGFFLSAKRLIVNELERRRPKVLVCVDYPGLNLQILQEAHKRGIATVWYIAPKVWAWKRKRAETLARYAGHVAAIFPFEVPLLQSYGATVSYVGNPLVEELQGRHEHLAPLGRRSGRPGVTDAWRLALVPGSRAQEVKRILPAMLGALGLLRDRRVPCRIEARVSRRGNLPGALYQGIQGKADMHTGPLDELLAWCDSALVTSGTATLEAALLGRPFVLVYRTSALTFLVGKMVLKIPHVGLPNILAGTNIVPELLQGRATPQALADETERYITDQSHFQLVADNLLKTGEILGNARTSTAVAGIIASYIS